MISAETLIRVRYQETDQMKVVYHANYFTWFEVARIELLDRMGCSYRDLERDGYLLPVLHCEAKFMMPAHFDDELTIRVLIKERPVIRIKIFYEVYRSEELLCLGNTTHAFINQQGKCIRPPQNFLKMAKMSLAESD